MTDEPEYVSPLRGQVPKKIVFGALVPCPSCHGKGGSCKRCLGNGYMKWAGGSAMTPPSPTTTPTEDGRRNKSR